MLAASRGHANADISESARHEAPLRLPLRDGSSCSGHKHGARAVPVPILALNIGEIAEQPHGSEPHQPKQLYKLTRSRRAGSLVSSLVWAVSSESKQH
jgi:hypothetical protein